MKRLLLTAGILAGMSGMAHALNPERLSAPDSYVTQGVYISSNTGVVTASTLSCIVSSYPAILHTVTINTPGSVAAQLELFDASFATYPATARKLATISTSSGAFTLHYDISTTSGLAINNKGTIPADITLTYREK